MVANETEPMSAYAEQALEVLREAAAKGHDAVTQPTGEGFRSGLAELVKRGLATKGRMTFGGARYVCYRLAVT